MSEQRRPGRPRASGRVASGDVRQELLVAASRIFSERGIAATRISDVADAVGLRPSAVYYHFAGLDEIVATLLRYVVDESAAFATAMADAGAEAAGPASERLRRLITQHVARMTAGPFDLWFVASMPIG
ncbi:MAG: TetR/AcrR family transcriptional regulator, partial [Acidimicrobiia bacterium]